MAERIQRPVLGAIFTVAIILLIIFFAFIWGRVILIKNADTSKVNTMVLNLENLDEAIRKCVETGEPQRVKLNLEDMEINITRDDVLNTNVIQMRATTVTPVLSFVTWVPINSIRLPYETDRFLRTLHPANMSLSCFYGMNGEWVKTASFDLYGEKYTAYVTKLASENCPYYVCLKNNLKNINCQDNCGCDMSVVRDGDKEYLIGYVDDEVLEIGGNIKEKTGIVGVDVPGVILGKAEKGEKENLNIIKLLYRPMTDGTNVTRIRIFCVGDCYHFGGEREALISFGSTLSEGDVTYYNVLISIR